MRYTFGLLCLLSTVLAGAQPTTSASTQHEISQLQIAMRSNAQAWAASPHVMATSQGYRLTCMAKVSESFSPELLPDGVAVVTRIGNIVTLQVDVHGLSRLSELPGVQQLELGRAPAPWVQKAIPDLRADSVHAGFGLPQGYSGKGVMLGVIDWGLDYTHPMFYDSSLTQTRIHAVWDQYRRQGPAPAGMGYGTEITDPASLAQFGSDTASVYDYATHGSHVAGIAAGGGAGVGELGVAYDADILFVQITLTTASVIDAIAWMKAQADAAGQRLVVNMSFGLYFLGPLDGTSLMSQAMDQFADQGVVLVTSGGNNGDVDFHIRHEFQQDSMFTEVHFESYALSTLWGQSISMWGEVSREFSAGLEIYSGGQLVAQSPQYSTATAAAYLDSMLIVGSDTILFNLTVDSAHPQNQRPHVRLRVRNVHTQYDVILKSFADQGVVHYWNVVELITDVGNWGQPLGSFGAGSTAGNDSYAIGEPACATKVITVAAHNGNISPGDITGFSSPGPRMDEVLKPEVSSPGSSVKSAVSSFTTRSFTSAGTTMFDGKTYHFARFSGTSMSSPGVAGVAALMLEANPQLSPAQVKDILMASAREDSKTGNLPAAGSVLWGHGKTTATRAVQAAVDLISSHTSPQHGLTIYPQPASGTLFVSGSAIGNGQAMLAGMDGRRYLCPMAAGRIDVSEVPAGLYLLRLPGQEARSAGIRVAILG